MKKHVMTQAELINEYFRLRARTNAIVSEHFARFADAIHKNLCDELTGNGTNNK